MSAESQKPPPVDPLTPDERRGRYFEEYKDRVDRYRQGSLFYEERALDLASSAMKALTYLNGGGLVAIPAVVALFRADPRDVKVRLAYAAAAFIAGLVFVVLAQAFSFFVMARRSEVEALLQLEQMELLAMIHYPGTTKEWQDRKTNAENSRAKSIVKTNRSNIWRALGIVSVWLSLFLFIAGCLIGGMAIVEAK